MRDEVIYSRPVFYFIDRPSTKSKLRIEAGIVSEVSCRRIDITATTHYHQGMAQKKPNSRYSAARTNLLDTAQRIVGAKGFSAVGLNQLLGAAGIPKGSFYYYFASKEAFGKDLLEHYFEKDLLQIDKLLSQPGRSARDRLLGYWRYFRMNQEHEDPNGKCLAVKLGAEVSDMPEPMRLSH